MIKVSLVPFLQESRKSQQLFLERERAGLLKGPHRAKGYFSRGPTSKESSGNQSLKALEEFHPELVDFEDL